MILTTDPIEYRHIILTNYAQFKFDVYYRSQWLQQHRPDYNIDQAIPYFNWLRNHFPALWFYYIHRPDANDDDYDLLWRNNECSISIWMDGTCHIFQPSDYGPAALGYLSVSKLASVLSGKSNLALSSNLVEWIEVLNDPNYLFS